MDERGVAQHDPPTELGCHQLLGSERGGPTELQQEEGSERVPVSNGAMHAARSHRHVRG